MLERISEVQLRHNRRKADLFRAVLSGRGMGSKEVGGEVDGGRGSVVGELEVSEGLGGIVEGL